MKLDKSRLHQSALDWLGPEQCHTDLRIYFHQKPTPSAIDGDAWQAQNRRFDIDRHALAGGKGRRASHQIAAVFVGQFRLAGRNRLAANLPSQVLGGHGAVSMHQHDQRLGLFVLHDQGFDYREWVKPQHRRTVLGTTVFQVLVRVFGESNLVSFEELGGGSFRNVSGLSHIQKCGTKRQQSRQKILGASPPKDQALRSPVGNCTNALERRTPLHIVAKL